MTMLAALELPDVPFHVLLTTHLTSTALQDDIMQHRSAFAEAVSQQRRIYPKVAEVCEVLQQFYNDSYAQHLKQDWLLKALKIPEARRHDVDYIAELLSTATEDFFLHAQQHGITATPLTKHTLATCSLFRLLLTVHKPPKVVILRFGPTLRLLANLKGQCRKHYSPGEVWCGRGARSKYIASLLRSSRRQWCTVCPVFQQCWSSCGSDARPPASHGYTTRHVLD